jgi:hypothetical protein
MSTDAIVLLTDDHKEIRRLFREFAAAGDGAEDVKGRIANQIIEALTVHLKPSADRFDAKIPRLVENRADRKRHAPHGRGRDRLVPQGAGGA